MKRRSPNFKLSMVDSIGDLILILGLNLSIVSPYYQGGRIWMNFRLSKCFIWDDILERHAFHSQNTLAQSFCMGSDHPGLPRMIRPNSDFQHWVSPDDPDWGFVSAWKGQAGWSGSGKLKCVFSLFCQYSGWSEITSDDPGTIKKHTTVIFGGGSIYTPSPPSFTSLSPDQPRLPIIQYFTSLQPRAWFL